MIFLVKRILVDMLWLLNVTGVHTHGLKWWEFRLASLFLNKTGTRVLFFPFLCANFLIRRLLNFAVCLWLVLYGAIDIQIADKRTLGLKFIGL